MDVRAAFSPNPTPRRRHIPHASQDDINGRRARRLIQEGQYSRAAKALVSRGIDQSSPEALAAMKEKHPQGPPPSIPTDDLPSPISVTSEKLAKAIKSFKPGSAPGPSGLRAEHLKAAVSTPTPTRADRAISVLKQLVNCILAGRVPSSIAAHFYGAVLFAATKKNGGFRPVAVGETLRRLASKVAAAEVSSDAADLLRPTQLAVGIRNGCESIVHALASLVANKDIPWEEKCILQVDLQNAFNLVNREAIFHQVRRHFPGLSAYVESSYGPQAFLVFGKDVLLSAQGVHQGDPLALLLFALAHKLLVDRLRELPLTMNAWLSDDGTLVGTPETLMAAVDVIRAEGPPLGLHLSPEKSSFWQGDVSLSSDPLHRNIPPASSAGFELLGAPLGTDSFIEGSLRRRTDRIAEIIDKLHLIDNPQLEYCVLRSCLSLPRFDFAARTTHPDLHASSMCRFDNLLRESVGSLLGHHLDDRQWDQASLPVSKGGLGLRRASLHSSGSYVSSIAHSFNLVSEILSPIAYSPFGLDAALESLNSHVDEPFAFEDIKSLPKKHITHAIDSKLHSSVSAAASTVHDRVRLSGVAKSRAGAWLNVVPSPGLGLSLHPHEFRCATLYRLGAPVFEKDAPCPACGRPSDVQGNHAIACAVNGERIARHNDLCNILFRTAQKANLGPAREFRGLIPGSAARPADIFLRNWERGRDVALDVTVISPLQIAVVDQEAANPGYALKLAWERKMRSAFEACRSQRVSFIPLPVETLGGWHPEAEKQISRIGRELARSTFGSDQKTASNHLFQRLSLALQKGNAALLLSRSTDVQYPDIMGQF